MPSRNVIREYEPQAYYHIYNRGVAKQSIFLDAADKQQFLKIIARHLDPADKTMKTDGSTYRKFHNELELLCYCLMGNHFHLLIYMNDDPTAIKSFMQAILTAYTMYFNKKYKRVGTIFQGVFRASRISNDLYLTHISRYIHLNPRHYKTYYYSSLKYYLGQTPPIWLKPDKLPVPEASGNKTYLEFLEDYEDHQAMLEELKHELADTRIIYDKYLHLSR